MGDFGTAVKPDNDAIFRISDVRLRQEINELRALTEFSVRALQLDSFERVNALCLQVVRNTLRADCAYIVETDLSDNSTVVIEQSGEWLFEDGVDAFFADWPAGLVDYAVAADDWVICADIPQEDRFVVPEIFTRRQAHSAIVALARSRAPKILGIAATFTHPRDLNEQHVQFLRTLGSMVTAVREREIVEEALWEAETEFRTLAETIPQLVWKTHADGRGTYCNQHWLDYTGLSLAESLRGDWTTPVNPEDRARAQDAWQQATSTLGTFSVECRLRRADGAYRWWLIRALPMHDAAGQVLKWFGTCTDIHELKEASIRVNELATLLDKARDAIIVTNLNYEITYWNKGAENLSGWTAEEVLGRSQKDFLFKDPAALDAAMDTLLADGEWAGELEQHRKDGTLLTVDARKSLVTDEFGNPTSILAINADITQKKKMEIQLLNTQRLESVGQLTGGVAHDFNNLLTIIRLNAEELARDFGQTPRMKETADMVLNASVRGGELVQKLLSFARQQNLEVDTVNLSALLSSFVKLLRRTIEAHIAIELHVDDQLPEVEVDPGQLENALMNLALNARDAMPNGGTITIEAATCQIGDDDAEANPDIKPGAYVVVSVSDNGCGMSRNIAERAFDPFFTTKEVGKGTGLGLSMVYGFAKQSGGHAKIYSEPGTGTTVRLYLKQATAMHYTRTSADTDSESVISPHGEHILVVEDDEMVRATLVTKLVNLRYRVTAAANANAALDYLKTPNDIALLFSDVVMPGTMNGADLAKEVRRQWPHIRILLSSGYTATAVLGKIQLPSDITFLSKPYPTVELIKALKKALANEPGTVAGPGADSGMSTLDHGVVS